MNLKEEQERLRLRNVTIPQTLRQARALRRKKYYSHKRYLKLKKEKRVLTRAVKAELQNLLVEFRELGKEMRIAKDSLNNVRDTAAQKTKNFLFGLEMGREEARVAAEQRALNQ